tara:strand:- start:831 stop:1163 length:333 start_codon:yes stop_codon:yes gene_type:complete
MKQFSNIIALGFRVLIFALVFGSIILQPVVESLAVSEPQAFSWLDLEAENDSSEKETQEVEDSKEKKVELRFVNEEVASTEFVKKVSIFGQQYLKSDVIIDTHDPPPEVV